MQPESIALELETINRDDIALEEEQSENKNKNKKKIAGGKGKRKSERTELDQRGNKLVRRVVGGVQLRANFGNESAQAVGKPQCIPRTYALF